jgi:transposase, IS30 family
MPPQLTLQERETVAQMHYAKKSAREIAKTLKRSGSTIARELARNGDAQGYSAVVAQTRCDERRRHRPWIKKMDRTEIGERVRAELVKCWSPDQIAGRSRRDAPRDKRAWVSHQTIYTWIKSQPTPEFWEQFLRRGGRRRPPNDRRGRIPGTVSIEGRPAVVDRRNRFGDWEGDTMLGRGSRAGLLTVVERKSGYLRLAKVDDRKAPTIRRAAKRKLGSLPPELRKTMTLDNGKEFADHAILSRQLAMKIYHARPYCAWQRGTNENTNGLVRQFFPKGKDLSRYSHQEVARAEILINERPRKRLGYKSPREILAACFPDAFEI